MSTETNQDPHVIDNETAGLNMTEAEQKVLDGLQGKDTDDNGDVELPSDKQTEEESNDEGDTLYAGKYKSVEELRKGISNIGSDLPDYILDGLSEAALEKHYKELESNIGSKKEEPTNEEKSTEEQKEEIKETISDDLFKEAEAEFIETDGLSTAMYEKLEKAGIPNHVVDKYIKSVEVERVAVANKIIDIAGGQEQFEAMKDWAENGGISESELEAIGNLPYEAMLGAIEGVKARYELANGKPNPVRLNGSTNNGGEGSYKDQNQYILDVSDRRYGRDRKYTARVDEKFKNSSFS